MVEHLMSNAVNYAAVHFCSCYLFHFRPFHACTSLCSGIIMDHIIHICSIFISIKICYLLVLFRNLINTLLDYCCQIPIVVGIAIFPSLPYHNYAIYLRTCFPLLWYNHRCTAPGKYLLVHSTAVDTASTSLHMNILFSQCMGTYLIAVD
jgi:hypothetical protein